jgi:phosphate-selective porin OprO/OprP
MSSQSVLFGLALVVVNAGSDRGGTQLLAEYAGELPTGWTSAVADDDPAARPRVPSGMIGGRGALEGNAGGNALELESDERSPTSGSVSSEAWKSLLKRVEPLNDESDAPPPMPAAPEGPPAEKWNIKLGGHVQLDYIMWPDADPAIDGTENYFNYRRLRLVADGTGYRQFDFRLQATLEPGEGSHESPSASPDVKDAYLSVNEVPVIGRIRVGNFFVPFSLEQVTNDTNNLFNERSIPTQGVFSPDREVGIAFYNCTADENITWSGGCFFDNISDTFKTRVDDNQGYRVSGRLTWLPYYDVATKGRYLVHTGAGVLYTDDHDDSVRLRARPQVQRGPILIDSGNLAADSYLTGNVELAIVWGPFALQNEAFISSVNMLTGDAIHVGGAYSHLSWFLTGENRIFERFGQHGAQFARSRPCHNLRLTPGDCRWGGWEAKARWSWLDLARADFGQYNDLTIGFNWYWSDRTRVMFDWIHPWTSLEAVFGETSSDLMAMRFDFNW